jgi:pantothenate kinase-related protein Tda10
MPLTPNEDGSYRYEFPTDSDENLAEVIEAFERLKEADSAYYRNIRAQAEEQVRVQNNLGSSDMQREEVQAEFAPQIDVEAERLVAARSSSD